MSENAESRPHGVLEITRAQFNTFNPMRTGLLDSITDEAEFYVADGEVVIGALIKDYTDEDWNFVVLGPDQDGVFRAIDVEVSVADVDEARERLVNAMRRHARSGNTVFPQ